MQTLDLKHFEGIKAHSARRLTAGHGKLGHPKTQIRTEGSGLGHHLPVHANGSEI